MNVVVCREADTNERIGFLQFVHLKCGVQLANRESCMGAPVQVFDMLCDGLLETPKGNRSLGLTQLLGVIPDFVHMPAREEKSALTKDLSI
jgi:hypothetical protein